MRMQIKLENNYKDCTANYEVYKRNKQENYEMMGW